MNIQAIVLDIDGVIVGEKIGYNSPDPHPTVVAKLKAIQNSGIPISLCTAKPHFAINKIIKEADLDNFHITDGGGVIINPLTRTVTKTNLVPNSSATKLVTELLRENMYVECYTVDEYVIQSSQVGEITTKHEHVIQSPPRTVPSLIEFSRMAQITKIMPIAINEMHKSEIEKVFEPFQNDLVLSWGVHPVILPLQFGIVTAPGISKEQGIIEIAQQNGIVLENTLGVGDSLSDWQFVKLCGFGAAMGNAKQDFKDLVMTKGNNGFIAPSVDENGIIKVFEYFGI